MVNNKVMLIGRITKDVSLVYHRGCGGETQFYERKGQVTEESTS